MVLSMERWQGKVAVVTGASVGIGASIAELLVKAGVQVVGLARRSELIEDLAKKLANEKGKLYAVKADVAKEQDILQAFKWIRDNLGPIHILVNNAGITQKTNLIEGDTEMWRKVFDVNVLGLCVATREAVKSMRSNNIAGHIVHLNSIAGHRVNDIPDMNVYFASKHAVTGLTETLRQELNRFGSKIKITSVSPGAVATEFDVNATDALRKAFEGMPMLEAEDVADAVMYALSTPPHVQVHELIIKPVNEEA